MTAAAAKFVEEPTVTVVVKAINSRKVFITGQVAKPGPYPLGGPTTVLQLISTAGGVAEYADKEKIVVLRTEAGKSVALPFNYKEVIDRQEAPAEHRAEAGRHGRGAVTAGAGWFVQSIST